MRTPRGQTFVLWMLTLLFLACAVLVTLGIGMRAKEATESQMVADAAAYSQAVTVARSFNAISTMNRAQVAATVAAAGTQAEISYSGVLLALLQAKCPDQTPDQTSSPQAKYWAADMAAANQMASLMGVAHSLYTAGVNIYANTISEQIANQNLTRQIAKSANKELQAPPKGANKSLIEVNGSAHVVTRDEIRAKNAAKDASVFNCSGSVCLVGENQDNLNATMGSMGWTWVRNRAAGGGITAGSAGFGSLDMKKPGTKPDFSSTGPMHTMFYKGVSGRNIWGHDHGGNLLPPCPGIDASDKTNYVTFGDAWVLSNDDTPGSDYHTDQHVIPTVQGSGNAYQEGAGKKSVTYEKHTLGPCSWCPGVFGSTVSWNIQAGESSGPANDYGQPKLYSMIERDYGTRKVKDPWNMTFKIDLGGGRKVEFDNASKKTAASLKDTNVMRTQVALSSGIVYYHRQLGGRWLEPPNFLNPFWRATLVSAVGASDDDPVQALKDAGYPNHAAALPALLKAGYKGMGRMK